MFTFIEYVLKDVFQKQKQKFANWSKVTKLKKV